MPIDANVFFQQAAAVSETTRFYVKPDDTIGQNSGLHGLQKLSSSCKKAENSAAAQAFLQALANNPQYGQYVGQVRGQLEALINSGKPLTAGQINQVKLTLDVAKGIEVGKQLAADNKLPQGHGTSFGQFTALRGLPLENEEQVKAAVKRYYSSEVIGRNMASLTALPNGDSMQKTSAMQTLLKNICSPLTGANGFFEKVLDDRLADFASFTFADFACSFQTENAQYIDIMQNLSAELVDSIKNMPKAKDILHIMQEALPFAGAEELGGLRNYCIGTAADLRTPQSRAETVKNYMTEQMGTSAAEQIMEQHGLPKQFASAIGHNPEVVAKAKEFLAENPGAGQIPTREQVGQALASAADIFTAGHKAELLEFKQMAENPPVEINPPLTADTMPAYINTMLAGDAVLEVLLNESTAADADFMQKLDKHAQAMNSATHSVKGDFGADDIAKILNNSIKILLSRRGVEPAQYGEVMARTISKFGPLASELQSLNSQVQKGFGGSAGMEFLRSGMTVFRSLEGHAKALISLMDHDQLVAYHIEEPEVARPGDLEAEKRNGRLLESFLESNFEQPVKLEKFSAPMRAYAEGYGFVLPPQARAANSDAEQARLQEINKKTSDAVFSAYIPETGRVMESKTQAFRDLFADIAARHDLAGIDIEKLDMSVFTPRVNDALANMAASANAEKKSLDSVEMHKAVEAAVTEDLLKLKETLNQIDALPASTAEADADDGVYRFSDFEKNVMKECALSCGMRDINAIAEFADAARELNCVNCIRDMAIPSATGAQLGETALKFSELYLAARDKLPKHFAGSDDACKFMANLALKFTGLSAQDTASLLDNLSSDLAKKVCGSFLWARRLPGVTGSQAAAIMGLMQSMTQIHSLAEIEVTGNSEIDPLYFAEGIDHPAQVPNGINGCMQAIKSLIGSALNEADEVLSRHVPPLSEQNWGELKNIIEQMTQSAGNNQWSFQIPYIVTASGTDLLQAISENKGKPLSPQQMWDVMIGGKRPSGLSGENFAAHMLNAANERYQKQIKAVNPDTPDPVVMSMFTNNLSLGVSPKKMFELVKPKGVLHLQDIHSEMQMSSMRGIEPKNAFGLTVDFKRQDPRATLLFTDNAGQTLQVHPHEISDEENNSNYPEFVGIMGKVLGMTHSDAQFRRVMQSFSQASLISPRMYSNLFPGVEYSEHGNFVMSAAEQPDGSVIMDITTDNSMPLIMHQQFRIETDGSHTCTKFEMKRS